MSLTVTLTDPTFPVATSKAEGELIDSLRQKCGFVLQGIDWVIEAVSGWSLLEAVFDPLLGDYGAVDAMSQNWHTMSTSLGHVAENYRQLEAALPEVWSGDEGSPAAQQKLADFAGGTDTQAEASRLISEALRDMLVAVKAAAEFIAELCSLIDEAVLKLLSGPLGVFAEIARGGATVRRIVTLCGRAIEVIRTLREVVPPLLQALAALAILLKALRIVFQVVSVATNATTGNKADEVAEVGF